MVDDETTPNSPEKFNEICLSNFYEVIHPFGNVAVRSRNGTMTYETVEPSLSPEERKTIEKLQSLLSEEMGPQSAILLRSRLGRYLDLKASSLVEDSKIGVDRNAVDKLLYYLRRDVFGYSRIEVMMHDPKVEDISCDGVGVPIYVWHKDYENIPTNVVFATREDLASFITRLALKCGGEITVTKPLLQGSLPEGFRAFLTLDQVSKRGPTFAIRKFLQEPPTIVDLVRWGTLSPKIAAYLWVCLENLKSLLVVGGSAAGKTTTIEALATLVKPESKVVTIEELREIRLLHENWIPLVYRSSGINGEQPSFPDLLKMSLGHRPEYLIVGEIRGEEASILPQAVSAGICGISSILSENVLTAVRKMFVRPIEVQGSLIPLPSTFLLVSKVKVSNKFVRRAISVSELVGLNEQSKSPVLNTVFEWTGEERDSFELRGTSNLFKQLADAKHISELALYTDMESKEQIVQWLCSKNISSYKELSQVVRRYYQDRSEVTEIARLGKDWKG